MPTKEQCDAEWWVEKRERRPNAPKRLHGRRPECLPDEDAAIYSAIEAEFYASLKPSVPEERSYVDDIIYCSWMLRRLDRTQVELYTFVHEHALHTHPDFPLGQPIAENPQSFNAIMWRYISLRKALKEAFAGFRELRENPLPFPPAPEPLPTETTQTPLREIGFDFSTRPEPPSEPAPEPPAHATLSDVPMSRPQPESADARRWHISGRVQGIGYRSFVQRAAVELGLTGFTRNLPDGRVEVYAAGPLPQLSAFAGILHKGPRWAEVRTVEEREESVTHHDGFHIR